ncbi:MAG: tyrosine-protein phosphatase [Sphingomonadales bacterium]
MIDRVLPFTGIHNFRDYGGYRTSDGHLVSGKLFRSGQHHSATAEDLAGIDQLGLDTIIDLRGDSERRRYPCARSMGFAAQVLFADGETAGAGGAAHVVAARDVKTEDDAFAAMVDLYTFMPNRPNLQIVFRHYFTSLVGRDGANLIHCFAGKDRTGLAVALLHRLLGVHEDDVMADYLLTNTAGNSAARIAAGAESIRRSRPDASDAAIARLMSVDAAYLEAAFVTIDRDWGGTANYARDVLGIDGAMLAAIRKRLIV